MIYPVQNFNKWYDAQSYGTKTSYGYHEGCDLNLSTGGDSDLGQALIAVADGIISSVHSHATNFGNHIHLEFKINDKTYYAHYAHCQDVYVSQGQTVKQGDIIATVGKSGTKYAHLHFAIKNQPTGVDGIAKTKEDLKKWENPLKFIEANLGSVIISEPNNMSQFTEEVFNKSKDVLPDQSYNFEDQLDKNKFKDELVVVKFNSLDEERRWRADRIKEIETLSNNYKSLMDTAQKQLKEIERLNNQMKSDIGGIFAPTDPVGVEIPVGDKKPVLTTAGDVVFNFLNSLWNKIKR